MWILILVEIVLIVLIFLFIGFVIDGLLEKCMFELYGLVFVFGVLIFVSVICCIYDIRIYGMIRVDLGNELMGRFVCVFILM